MLIYSNFFLLNDYWANCTLDVSSRELLHCWKWPIIFYHHSQHQLLCLPLCSHSLQACFLCYCWFQFLLCCLCYKGVKPSSCFGCAVRQLHSVMVLLHLCFQRCQHSLISPNVSYFAWLVLASACHRAGISLKFSPTALTAYLCTHTNHFKPANVNTYWTVSSQPPWPDALVRMRVSFVLAPWLSLIFSSSLLCLHCGENGNGFHPFLLSVSNKMFDAGNALLNQASPVWGTSVYPHSWRGFRKVGSSRAFLSVRILLTPGVFLIRQLFDLIELV